MTVIERIGSQRRPIKLPEAPKVNPAAGKLTPEEAAALKNAKPISRNSNINWQAVAKRREEMSIILPLGKQFLNSLNNKNVIPQTEFEEYLPLFNKSLLDQMDDSDKAKLAFRWSQRINIQQSVKVIDTTTPDENGILYRGRRFKLVLTLPAWTNRYESVNAQGDDAVAIAAECLANSRSTNNPFDTRQAQYSSKLVALLRKGNAESLKRQNEERERLAEKLGMGSTPKPADKPTEAKPKPAEKQVTKPVVEEPPSLDAEWED